MAVIIASPVAKIEVAVGLALLTGFTADPGEQLFALVVVAGSEALGIVVVDEAVTVVVRTISAGRDPPIALDEETLDWATTDATSAAHAAFAANAPRAAGASASTCATGASYTARAARAAHANLTADAARTGVSTYTACAALASHAARACVSTDTARTAITFGDAHG
jgi:hypothetical protein